MSEDILQVYHKIVLLAPQLGLYLMVYYRIQLVLIMYKTELIV